MLVVTGGFWWAASKLVLKHDNPSISIVLRCTAFPRLVCQPATFSSNWFATLNVVLFLVILFPWVDIKLFWSKPLRFKIWSFYPLFQRIDRICSRTKACCRSKLLWTVHNYWKISLIVHWNWKGLSTNCSFKGLSTTGYMYITQWWATLTSRWDGLSQYMGKKLFHYFKWSSASIFSNRVQNWRHESVDVFRTLFNSENLILLCRDGFEETRVSQKCP